MRGRLRIGLTGGIACGKSTVADLFAALGVPIVDTDLLSREVVEPGSPLLRRITEHFGLQVQANDGSLNRRDRGSAHKALGATGQGLRSLDRAAVVVGRFRWSDIGIVGDWREVVPLLVDRLGAAMAAR